jgi:ATP-dependent Lhr-like helicase
VKPVPPEADLRFLARWHGLHEPLSGPAGLEQALGRLEGWAATVDGWERSLLAVRCREEEADLGASLDPHFLSGRLSWFRPPLVTSAGRQPQLASNSPVILVPRAHRLAWCGSVGLDADRQNAKTGGAADTEGTEVIREALARGGALFTADLEAATGLASGPLKEALRTLVYRGEVTADAFSLLRWLLRPESVPGVAPRSGGRHGRGRYRRRQGAGRAGRTLPVGRWSLLHPVGGRSVPQATGTDLSEQARQEQLAIICEALLRRYGVVFRTVLQREPLLPPWRDLLRYYRRMEDRGEVRGGRFVDGFSGEQFALPEAVGALFQRRGAPDEPVLTVISAADPLNLGGIITPGPKTPALAGHRLLLEDGLPVARLRNEQLEELPGITRRSRQIAPELLRGNFPWPWSVAH